MAYIYQIEFEIPKDKMGLLEIGSALEKALGYLKTLLPSESGFISARAMHSLNGNQHTLVVFQSEWDYWKDLDQHIHTSYLDEDKLLTHFQPHVKLEDLKTYIFEEIP